MTSIKTLILGGGLAGISAAYHSDSDHLVLEKSGMPGGLASSMHRDGFTFDHTGHLLHLRDPYALKLIPELLRDNLTLHQRSAWIYSHNVFTRYPYQAFTHGLPKRVVSECVNGFKKAMKQKKRKPTNFKQWVLQTFGTGFAKHFFFPYNEKLWTVPPEKLTTEWMGQFVPTPPLAEVLSGAANHNHITNYGYNSQFYYPKVGGIYALVQAFLDSNRVNIRCNTLVTEINLKEKWVCTQNGDKIRYKNLINTLPLPFFVRMLKHAPIEVYDAALRLHFTSVYNLNIGVRQTDVGGGKQWVYYPERKYIFYRVGFPQSFANATAPRNCSSIYLEVACNRTKGLIDTGALRNRCVYDLQQVGLLGSAQDIMTEISVLIPVAYVIFDKDRTPNVNRIFDYLKDMRVQSIGRYGKWEYSYMEAAIMQGKKAAEEIGGERKE